VPAERHVGGGFRSSLDAENRSLLLQALRVLVGDRDVLAYLLRFLKATIEQYL